MRASDTATETMLYRNWLRGVLGSADSETAKKYGQALYDAKSLTWDEAASIRSNPATRDVVIKAKQQQWAKVAEQIKTEDPEAYEYLQGTRDMDRIGAGSSRCWPRCCSPCSTSRRRCWCCSAS